MGDVAILETAQDIGHGVDLADIGQELVAQPFPLRGAADQARDIDEIHARRDDFLGACDLRQFHQARFGHGDLAHVRLDRAERIIRRLRRRRLGERVEEGRLADIGQADDAAFEAHR